MELKKNGSFRNKKLSVFLLGDVLESQKEVSKLVCSEQVNRQMPVLEFTEGVDNFVEGDLNGVHERVQVPLGLDRLEVIVVSSGRKEVLGNYSNVL